MSYVEVPSFREKTNRKIIKNKYNIINSYHHDFGLVIYYLEKNKVQVILRKFNCDVIGWSENIKISIDEGKEIIDVGSCLKNEKKCNVMIRSIVSQKDSVVMKVPKIIYQTYTESIFHNESHKQALHHLLDLHPDYEYRFFTDYDCNVFIKEHYPDFYIWYHKLYPSAYRADFFRYLLIYHFGGIYLDHKYIVRQSFENIIDETTTQLYCEDVHPSLIFNSIIISTSKNPKLHILLNKIIMNIENNQYGVCPLHPTGPRLFGDTMDTSYIQLKHEIIEPRQNYKNGRITLKKNNEIFLTTSYQFYYFNKNHRNQIKNDYDYCYRNRLIYCRNKKIINGYIFMINCPDIIHFDILINEKTFQLNLHQDLNKKYKLIVIGKERKEIDIKDCLSKYIQLEKN